MASITELDLPALPFDVLEFAREQDVTSVLCPVAELTRDVFPNASMATYAARQRAFREGRPTTGNAWHYTWTTADGTVREADFRYIYQPLRGAAGQVEGLMLIATEKPD